MGPNQAHKVGEDEQEHVKRICLDPSVKQTTGDNNHEHSGKTSE